ncbi:MAG: DUF5691 domain-containing protein [Mastigocoleus sp.]
MNLWQNIVKTALVGTERQELQFETTDEQLKEIIQNINNKVNNTNDSKIETQDIEGNLLSAAGVISLYQKAGNSPKIGSELNLKTCEPEDDVEYEQVIVNHRMIAQYLSIILAEKNAILLPEWLKLATSVQKTIPPNYLPELLSLGKKNKVLRDSILPLIGKRGRWLAAQNSEWSYAVSGDEETTWKKGSPYAKQLLLKELREKDSKVALKVLEKYWKKQKIEDKTALLDALKINLSIDDEEFLETVLDDKRKQVRDIAGELLASLPESSLVERMILRVSPLISLNNQTNQTNQNNQNNIEIQLPSDCTREMTRDGIDQSKYNSGLGEKASLLLQMLCFIPPKFWSETLNKTPQELIQITTKSEWERLLLEGWVNATIRNKDEAWLLALIEHIPFRLNSGYLQSIEQMIQGLLEILDSTQAQKLILEILSNNQNEAFHQKNPVCKILNVANFYWELELSKTVLYKIHSSIEKNDKKYNFVLENLIKHCSIYMEPTLVDEATQMLTPLVEGNYYWDRIVDEFLGRLRLRSQIRKAFK